MPVCVQKLVFVSVFACSAECGSCFQHVISEWTLPPGFHKAHIWFKGLRPPTLGGHLKYGLFWVSSSHLQGGKYQMGHIQESAYWQTQHTTATTLQLILTSEHSLSTPDAGKWAFTARLMLYFPSAAFCWNWAMKTNPSESKRGQPGLDHMMPILMFGITFFPSLYLCGHFNAQNVSKNCIPVRRPSDFWYQNDPRCGSGQTSAVSVRTAQLIATHWDLDLDSCLQVILRSAAFCITACDKLWEEKITLHFRWLHKFEMLCG